MKSLSWIDIDNLPLNRVKWIEPLEMLSLINKVDSCSTLLLKYYGRTTVERERERHLEGRLQEKGQWIFWLFETMICTKWTPNHDSLDMSILSDWNINQFGRNRVVGWIMGRSTKSSWTCAHWVMRGLNHYTDQVSEKGSFLLTNPWLGLTTTSWSNFLVNNIISFNQFFS